MRIYLTGFMASGKTTYGKALADFLDYKFIDTDALIEKREKKSITDIFHDNGESYFRKLETLIIKEISTARNLVVSTGGGLIANIENLEIIKNSGFLIFLKVKKEVIFERILRGSETRPMLFFSEEKNKRPYLEKLYTQRIPFYRVSNLIINPEKYHPEQLAAYLKQNRMA